MKKVWAFVFLFFFIILLAFFKQEKIEDEVGIEKPDSKVGKKIDEAMGLEQIHQLDRAKKVGAEAEFNSIRTAFAMYYTTYGTFPKSLEELVNSRYIDRGALSDFWQQGYRTEIDGADLVLTSPGPDRIKNTKDDVSTRIPLMPGSAGTEWEGTTKRTE